jgi:hypothetical protein
MVFGLASTIDFCWGPHDECEQKDTTGGEVVFWIGTIGMVPLVLWDIIDSPFSAARFNEKHKESLTLAPMVLPPPPNAQEQVPAIGFALSGRF